MAELEKALGRKQARKLAVAAAFTEEIRSNLQDIFTGLQKLGKDNAFSEAYNRLQSAIGTTMAFRDILSGEAKKFLGSQEEQRSTQELSNGASKLRSSVKEAVLKKMDLAKEQDIKLLRVLIKAIVVEKLLLSLIHI